MGRHVFHDREVLPPRSPGSVGGVRFRSAHTRRGVRIPAPHVKVIEVIVWSKDGVLRAWWSAWLAERWLQGTVASTDPQ